MKVCEACGGSGCHRRTYQGQAIQVQCGCCLGTGMLCLGFEASRRYAEMRAAARQRGERGGWYEVAWEGEPGQAKQVVRPMAQAARKTA